MISSYSEPYGRRFSWGFAFFVLLVLLSVGFAAGSLHNTFALEPGLEAQAREIACAPASAPQPAPPQRAGPSATPAARPGVPAPPPPQLARPCALQTTLWQSGPFGRTFGFENRASSGRVFVQCQRQYWAVGDYACAKAQ